MRSDARDGMRFAAIPITLVPFERFREWRCFGATTGIESAWDQGVRWKDDHARSAAMERLLRV